MNFFLKTALPFLLFFLFIHCEDPIRLKGRRQSGLLVVNGKISTIAGPQTISLGFTSPDDRIPVPAVGAQIRIFDDGGNSEPYMEVREGVFELPGNIIKGVAGRSYFIEVNFDDGKRYRSKPERIPETTARDSAYFNFYKKDQFIDDIGFTKNVIGIYTDTQIQESDQALFIRWDVEEVYMLEETPIWNPFTGTIPLPCFISGYPDPQRINLFTTSIQHGQKITGTLVAEHDIDYTFLAKHYFIVNLSSITEASHTYWQQVNGLINKSGSIFDTPPAPVKGNLFNVDDETEQVLGYFEASNTTVSRIFTIRGYIPFAVPFYCYDPAKGLYSRDYPSPCSDCLMAPNSSHEKPEWF